MDRYNFDRRSGRRKGAAAVFSVIILVVLIGFACLTLDVGAMYNTRADLQNAADAAALAAAATYTSPTMTQVRLGKALDGDFQQVLKSGRDLAKEVAIRNWSFAASGTKLMHEDITFGWIDVHSSTSPIDTGVPWSQYNAVRVVTRRDKSINGPLQFFFASIFGKKSTAISASAVAAYVGTVNVYDISVPGAAPIWPFTMSETEYDKWVESATDKWHYNPDTGEVSSGSDKEVEVRIYPEKLAPGNYGLLNIGTSNQSTTALEGQILNGVGEGDLELEIGTSVLQFTDEEGNPMGYDISGNSGLKSALEAPITERYGDVVAFFVHDQVTGGGANVSYHITGIRFARVMHSALQGSKKLRGLWMQPVNYTGPGIISIPGSSGSGGQVLLVR